MEELGNNKQEFLEQVQQQQNQVSKEEFLELLKEMLNIYSDLCVEDYKGSISDSLYKELEESLRDPEELALWNKITTNPTRTVSEIQTVLGLILDYERKYPHGTAVSKVNTKKTELQGKLDDIEAEKKRLENLAKEQNDWNSLNKEDYQSLRSYKQNYPETVHKSELDDLMWTATKKGMTTEKLNHYLDDWRFDGKHVEEANSAKTAIKNWETVRQSGDIIEVAKFRKSFPDVPFIDEVLKELERLQVEELSKMRKNPSNYKQKDIQKLLDAGAFSEEQLVKTGLATYNSLKAISVDKSLLPDLKPLMAKPNVVAEEGCTDVYLFGTPGTGKTCLLMGLTGGDGKKYSINFKEKGGPYASALQQYVKAGITPPPTNGDYVTTIKGLIEEKTEKDVYLNHLINFVEMSGEEFAIRIAEGDAEKVELDNMGTGTTKLLGNDNRKVFFIVVDPTVDKIKITYEAPVYDNEGNIIDKKVKEGVVDQAQSLGKFVDLFELPQNKELMKRVDAIHFIVTKSDIWGHDEDERKQKAHDLLIEKYSGIVTKLVGYCRRTKRINYSTDYHSRVYPFSLGKFYLGGVFDFEVDETLKIIDTLRHITVAYKEPNFWDKLRDTLA